MLYAKDKDGKLRSFTMDDDNADLGQVSTFDKQKAVKMTALQEAGLELKGAVVCCLDGGKV
ncbi:hypothetical protein [Pseudoalteromonas phage PH357]|nr:hypothetical protein [Pseudoalteromonas phage PH357]